MTEEIEPHIYLKYEIKQRLGKGAYGVVWKAVEKKTRVTVALKKVFDAFSNDTDAQRTFREIMILQQLDHPHMVRLLNVIKAENNKDIYLIFEYMETDLHTAVRAQILEPIHKTYITYQLLKSLLYLHTAEIVHRDLKPSNMLINGDCLIKLADFGLARSTIPEDEDAAPIMTDYVATRWYRAPEIVLGSRQYSKGVDMWSVGCILAEMIIGKALFQGKSTVNQIELMIELLGRPTKDDLEQIGGASNWNLIDSISTSQKMSLQTYLKPYGATDHTVQFIKRCLEYNPKRRITVEQALKHPYVIQFHNPTQEIVAQKPIVMPISDQKKLSSKEYREALYTDIIRKKKEQRKKWHVAYLRQLGINVSEDDPNTVIIEKLNAVLKMQQQSGMVGKSSIGPNLKPLSPNRETQVDSKRISRSSKSPSKSRAEQERSALHQQLNSTNGISYSSMKQSSSVTKEGTKMPSVMQSTVQQRPIGLGSSVPVVVQAPQKAVQKSTKLTTKK
jgi:mitogen-activated protein kinase 15